MILFTEWLAEKGIDELGSGDLGMETQGDVKLAEDQATLLVQRFGGLLHHLNNEEKSQVIRKIVSELKSL